MCIIKEPVSKEDEFLTALQYEMYSVDYDTLLNVAVGLKAIAEHVKQVSQIHWTITLYT